MPIYEFRCNTCDEKFDKLCSISAGVDGGVACPKCESGDTKRLMSAFYSRSSGGSSSSCNCGGNCGRSSCAGCHH